MEAKEFAIAVHHYKKAASGQPHDSRMFKALGEALHVLSQGKPAKKAFHLEKRAAEAFEKAAQLVPIDAEAYYGLARSTLRLEQMHALLHPTNQENPFRPLPYFHRAIDLRPNGILYRYAFAQYLFHTGDIYGFRKSIKNLVRTYPPTYYHLKKEPFWSKSLYETVQLGLLQAVEAGTMLWHTYMALADLLELEQKPIEAIRYYSIALQHSPHKNLSTQQIHLGSLYLQSRQPTRAEQAFLLGLRQSASPTSDLRGIFSAYKTYAQPQSFIAFFKRADHEIPFSLKDRLVVARALIETQAFFEARNLLDRLNRQRPTAEAHYLLYKVAREQKDLDSMELAIQKATVLEPQNSRYHYLFSHVLRQDGKLEDAEKAITRAIDLAENPSASMLHYRAKIRLHLNEPAGALSDWNEAMVLEPENAAYHAYAAETLIQLARFDQALAHAAKATTLEPENAQYRERHAQLKEMLKRR